MTALRDCLKLEAHHAEEMAGQLGDYAIPVDAIIWLCFQVTAPGPAISHPATTSLSRLLVDSTVHVEQAFVTVIRGQPRLGWTSLRLAAEALKDLLCIEQEPTLHALWLSLGKCSSVDEVQTAKAAFQQARKGVPKSALIKICEKSMSLCNHFGAHPNASSWATLGKPSEGSRDHLRIPARLADPDMVRWHVQHMLVHTMPMVDALAQFRAKYLPKDDAATLVKKRDEALRRVWPIAMKSVEGSQERREGIAS